MNTRGITKLAMSSLQHGYTPTTGTVQLSALNIAPESQDNSVTERSKPGLLVFSKEREGEAHEDEDEVPGNVQYLALSFSLFRSLLCSFSRLFYR